MGVEMRIKGSFSIGILMTLLLFSLASFMTFAQEEPLEKQASSETGGIAIEGAKATWEAEMTVSGELTTATDKVLPRLLIEQAAILWGADLEASQELVSVAEKVTDRLLIEQAAITSILNLSGSDALIKATGTVAPRILIEHAATTALIKGLQGSPGLLEATSEMSPRILIEHAETMQCYELSPFQPIPPPTPNGVPVWWIILGLVAAVALVIALTKGP